MAAVEVVVRDDKLVIGIDDDYREKLREVLGLFIKWASGRRGTWTRRRRATADLLDRMFLVERGRFGAKQIPDMRRQVLESARRVLAAVEQDGEIVHDLALADDWVGTLSHVRWLYVSRQTSMRLEGATNQVRYAIWLSYFQGQVVAALDPELGRHPRLHQGHDHS